MHAETEPVGLWHVFAAQAGGALWWIGHSLYRYGPSWQIVPPLLLACASLVGAVHTFAEGRHRRQLERAEQARRYRLPAPTYDQLEGRGH